MVTMCATVFSPSVLERMVEAFVTTRDGSAGMVCVCERVSMKSDDIEAAN